MEIGQLIMRLLILIQFQLWSISLIFKNLIKMKSTYKAFILSVEVFLKYFISMY